MRFSRETLLRDLLPLLLTAIIAVSACVSSYYAYKSAQIATEMTRIQSRQEIFEYVSAILTSLSEVTGDQASDSAGEREDTEPASKAKGE